MKKGRAFPICLFSIAMGLILALGVIGAVHEAQAQFEPAAPLPPLGVGLVIDENGLEDTFNWTCYQGLLQAQSELGVVGTVYTPTNNTEYDAKMQQCLTDGNALCIGVNFLLAEATLNAANNNPGTKFAIVDWSEAAYPANLRGITFASDQVGFLAGVLAGMMSESNLLGDIGGMPFPAVDDFVFGYRNGAHYANPAARVRIAYSWDFFDPDLGAQMAQEMIAQGADVIFAAAGPTGFGAVLTATQSGVWGIGVDMDFYDLVYAGGTVPGADKLLSSAMKHFDLGIFETISDTVHGAFTSGTVQYGLDVGGVGLAPFHDADAAVPQAVRDALAATTAGIIDGSIDITDDYREYVFLPAIHKP